MKKAALILVVLFLAAGLWVLYCLRSLGPSDAARLIPGDTLALIELPDLASSSQRWPATALAQIGAEPEMKAFMERPLGRLRQAINSGVLGVPGNPARSGSGVTGTTIAETPEVLISRIKPGRFFMAAEPLNDQLGWVVGCQFFGSKDEVTAGVARINNFLDSQFGTGESVVLDSNANQGEKITQATHGPISLFYAIRGNWCFFGNSLEPVKNSLAFSAGRRPQAESLAANDLYKKNRSRLTKEAELLVYATPDRLSRNWQQLPPLPIGNLPDLSMVHSLGLSLSFSGDAMDEILYLGGDFSPSLPLAHKGLPFTHPTTAGYFEWSNDWKKTAADLQSPGIPAGLAQLLGADNLDLTSLAELLKPEVALLFDWPQGSMFPMALLALPVNDQIKAVSWLDQVIARLPAAQVGDKNGVRLVTLPQLNSLIHPALSVATGYLLAGTGPDIVGQATQITSTDATLETAPEFAKALPLYREANQVFGYLSTREFFEHAYATARPALMLTGAFMPGVSVNIDVSKLPQSATIAKHLTPIVYAQSREEGGLIIHSTGPLSASQFLILAASASAASMPKR